MFPLQSIGVVRSPYQQATGTPVQPFAAGQAHARIELQPELAEGLRDLEGFERIWLIYWCHRACDARLTVVPYRDTKSHGVFATRAPARPNRIGLSTVRLDRIEGNVLHVSEVDILDGTPVLDIKPYVPQYDSYVGVRTGWLDGDDPLRRTLVADGRFEAACMRS